MVDEGKDKTPHDRLQSHLRDQAYAGMIGSDEPIFEKHTHPNQTASTTSSNPQSQPPSAHPTRPTASPVAPVLNSHVLVELIQVNDQEETPWSRAFRARRGRLGQTGAVGPQRSKSGSWNNKLDHSQYILYVNVIYNYIYIYIYTVHIFDVYSRQMMYTEFLFNKDI